jgi:excisionase family DNA binding protein
MMLDVFSVLCNKIEITKTATETQPKRERELSVLTVRELAGYLRVHQTTGYRLLREQRLPAFRVGADWPFNREAIERWISEQQKQS